MEIVNMAKTASMEQKTKKFFFVFILQKANQQNNFQTRWWAMSTLIRWIIDTSESDWFCQIYIWDAHRLQGQMNATLKACMIKACWKTLKLDNVSMMNCFSWAIWFTARSLIRFDSNRISSVKALSNRWLHDKKNRFLLSFHASKHLKVGWKNDNRAFAIVENPVKYGSDCNFLYLCIIDMGIANNNNKKRVIHPAIHLKVVMQALINSTTMDGKI